MNYSNFYLAIGILTIFCLGLSPLFIADLQPRIHEISVSGTLGNVLRTSVTIKVMAGISIGTTLPVLTDIFLDKISNISFVDLTNTFVVILGIILSSTLYLSLNDQYYMAYLYVSLLFMVTIISTSAILQSISRGVVATKWKMNPLWFTIPTVGLLATYIFVILVVLFPEISVFILVLYIIRIVGAATYLWLQGYWFYCLWRHYKSIQRFGVDEMKEVTYMVGELVFVCFLGADYLISHNALKFLNADENFLIIYYTIVILCCLIMTVLPGRLLRKLSEIKESVLQMKREFVRYLSHEIRSPLNVSHAGLEILKAELEVMGASLAILSLVDDIFSASSAAIEILNDSLHYEHMDSGTFKLELAVTPLRDVFAGRLEAYKYMATKKSITLRIEDLVQASEYYAGDNADADVAAVDAEEGRPLYARQRDASGSASPASSSSILVLYIDRFRVEQIIRNLMSNAIKFTPEGGKIAMRITRIAATTQQAHKEASPVAKLQDSSLDKTVAGYLRFEVVDSGAGISLENQPKMFNEFMQFNRNALQGGGGSGLGLWICKNLATLHGGKLDFRSDGEGLGSTFAVELPIYNRTVDLCHEAPDIESTMSIPASSRPRPRPRPRLRATNIVQVVPAINPSNEATSHGDTITERAAWKLSVLIVDDSSANRKIVRRMLESSANRAVLGDCTTILEADDGTTALEVLRSESAAGRVVDFVLLDYVMVRMNGPEAARRMRAELGYRGVVIGITGNALPEDLAAFRDHGATVVLTKPLTNAKLMDAIYQSSLDRTVHMV